MAGGTISAMTRAPWLPPNTNRRTTPPDRRRVGTPRAAAITAGRNGLPVCVALAASAGVASSTPGKLVAIAVTRGASSLLARPMTAILFVNECRDTPEGRCKQRRQCRIAAEADHGSGLDPRRAA